MWIKYLSGPIIQDWQRQLEIIIEKVLEKQRNTSNTGALKKSVDKWVSWWYPNKAVIESCR